MNELTWGNHLDKEFEEIILPVPQDEENLSLHFPPYWLGFRPPRWGHASFPTSFVEEVQSQPGLHFHILQKQPDIRLSSRRSVWS